MKDLLNRLPDSAYLLMARRHEELRRLNTYISPADQDDPHVLLADTLLPDARFRFVLEDISVRADDGMTFEFQHGLGGPTLWYFSVSLQRNVPSNRTLALTVTPGTALIGTVRESTQATFVYVSLNYYIELAV
jgi:hypothetical protein